VITIALIKITSTKITVITIKITVLPVRSGLSDPRGLSLDAFITSGRAHLPLTSR
jgi:hypothetical protein